MDGSSVYVGKIGELLVKKKLKWYVRIKVGIQGDVNHGWK